MGLGLSADGTPALVLFDQNGKDRAELHLNNSGKPGLALADENGKSIAVFRCRFSTVAARMATDGKVDGLVSN